MVSSLPATSNLQDSKARHSTGTTTAEHVEVLLAVQLVSWTEAVQHRHLWHFPSAYMHAKQYIPQLMLGTPPLPLCSLQSFLSERSSTRPLQISSLALTDWPTCGAGRHGRVVCCPLLSRMTSPGRLPVPEPGGQCRRRAMQRTRVGETWLVKHACGVRGTLCLCVGLPSTCCLGIDRSRHSLRRRTLAPRTAPHRSGGGSQQQVRCTLARSIGSCLRARTCRSVHDRTEVTHARRDRSLLKKARKTCYCGARPMGDRPSVRPVRSPRYAQQHMQTQRGVGDPCFDHLRLPAYAQRSSESFWRPAGTGTGTERVKSWFRSARSDSDRLFSSGSRPTVVVVLARRRRIATVCRGVGLAPRTVLLSPQLQKWPCGRDATRQVVFFRPFLGKEKKGNVRAVASLTS